MKKLLTSVLCFFVCLSGFSQSMKKQYDENDQALGGDVILKSTSEKVENNEIFKTFEVESLEAGAYYLDAWMIAPSTKAGYPEYTVSVNGVLSQVSFKPQKGDWHSLALTDVKKAVATVQLKRGINEISVIGKGPEIPHVEFIKLSSNLVRTGISDSDYKTFVESVESNTLNEVYQVDYAPVSSTRGTNGELYDYYLDIPIFYTTNYSFNFTAGQTVNITTTPGATTPASNHMIEFFHATNSETYSWHSSTTTGSGSLSVSIPATGTYHLCLRIPPPSSTPFSAASGFVNLTVNGSTYSNTIVSNSVNSPVARTYLTPANFFICKVNLGNPYLYLENSSGYIKGFNTGYGTTSDGYLWGKNSRIITNLTNISRGHVFAGTTSIPSMKCDLYMGLVASTRVGTPAFPLLAADNSFRSAPGSGVDQYLRECGYNCIDWSVGIYADSMSFVTENWKYFNNINEADTFYTHYGYTREGANENNAAIALWMNGILYTHASVRKNSVIPNPHGFEWESKCGLGERVMHTRDALTNDLPYFKYYGHIEHYYRPISGSVNSPPVNNDGSGVATNYIKRSASKFTSTELNQISELMGLIPLEVILGFEEKYGKWINTFNRPEIAIHSNPYLYAKTSEYDDLVQFCKKYGRVSWPLIIDKLAQGNIFTISLLSDLTYVGEQQFDTHIKSNIKVLPNEHYPSTHSILVDYCKGLLSKEESNILKSIRDISAKEEGSFIATIHFGDPDILINLNLVKEEKASIKIFNVFGGLEYEAGYNLSRGEQRIAINASNFKKGILIVQVTIRGESVSQTISI